MTSVTAQPVATQGWVFPLTTGSSGMKATGSGSSFAISMMAQTISGTAKDSTFLIVNVTKGTSAPLVWTKADALVNATVTLTHVTGDELALVQVTEDGTTEFADAIFSLRSV